MSEKILSIKDLGKSFGNHEVLRKIDIEVNKGEVICIVGSSGSGKSTLLRCINRLEKQTRGQIFYHDKEVRDVQKEINDYRSKVGMVFQSFNLFNNMTVLENCMLCTRKVLHISKEEAFDRAITHLKEVGMAPYINAKPSMLSGGQKQRVAIARALVLDPEFLLCDEATSALDPEITKGILALLQKINKEMGITIIIVTHQMEVVKQVCQKVAFLSSGKMLAVGKPEQLFVWPKEREIRDFLREESDKLPATGVNLKLFFYGEGNQRPIVTQMSQELHTDFNICWAKLEDFREDVYGSLVLNMEEKDLDRACAFLDSKGVTWEVIK